MTFTPGSGIVHWNYPYADEFLGSKLTLPLDVRTTDFK